MANFQQFLAFPWRYWRQQRKPLVRVAGLSCPEYEAGVLIIHTRRSAYLFFDDFNEDGMF
jgi:hypothetical protein